jgi:plasmid maintenance system antidote protein VapI
VHLRNNDLNSKEINLYSELKRRMKELGWQQRDLSHLLGFSLKHTNEILNGKQHLSFEAAVLLSEIFDTDPRFWLELDMEARIENNKMDLRELDNIRLKSYIFQKMPILEMKDRNWIKNIDNLDELLIEVMDFWKLKEFDLDFLDEPIEDYKAPIKEKSSYYSIKCYIQKVKNYPTIPNKFDRSELKDYILKKAIPVSDDSQGLVDFLTDLHKIGLQIIFLQNFKSTNILGYLDYTNQNPKIALTLYHNHYDQFIIEFLIMVLAIFNDSFKQKELLLLENNLYSNKFKLLHNQLEKKFKAKEINSLIEKEYSIEDEIIEIIADKFKIDKWIIKNFILRNKINHKSKSNLKIPTMDDIFKKVF